jgi:phosphomevalonate kinase
LIDISVIHKFQIEILKNPIPSDYPLIAGVQDERACAPAFIKKTAKSL